MKLFSNKRDALKDFPDVLYSIQSGREVQVSLLKLRAFGFKMGDLTEYAEKAVNKYFKCLSAFDGDTMRNTVSYDAYYHANVIRCEHIIGDKLLSECEVTAENARFTECVKAHDSTYYVYTSIDIKVKSKDGEQRDLTILARMAHKIGSDLIVYKKAMIEECPLCGNEISIDLNGNCTHCNARLSFGDECWVLDGIFLPKE